MNLLLESGVRMNLTSIIVAIILFSIIVLFHELGHFLLAKANGIKVNEFCLGLGPTIIGKKFGDTVYSIKLLPFGGACMMEGEDEDSNNDNAFNNKSVWARISVVFAGPLFNFIMAFVFAVIIIMAVGYDKPMVSDVIDGYAAQEAGIKAGDEIVKINNYPINFYKEISVYSFFHSGETVDITVKRDGEKKTFTLTPKYSKEAGTYLYGFTNTEGRVKVNFFSACVHGVHEVKYWIYYTLQSLKFLVTGGASVNDLQGPVGIVKNIGDAYQTSVSEDGYFYGFLNVLQWGILLSANLGVMNLLPLPALDGGRLVFLIIEAIRRKKIDPNKEGMVHAIGIILLLGLMVLVMGNDIRKIFF